MDLQAIEARLAAATPGPWEAQPFESAPREDAGSPIVGGKSGIGLIAYTLRSGAVDDVWFNKPQCEADAEFIAHAPADIRALIDEVGRLTVEHLEMRIERDNLRERRDYYRKALMKADGEIEAVKRIHAPEVVQVSTADESMIDLCWCCKEPHPCETARALGVTE